MNEIKDKMKEIERKQAQAVELREQLTLSLALQELWPGVFSANAHVVTQWQGGRDIMLAIKRTVPLPSNMKTEVREFLLHELPECLRATMPTSIAARRQEQTRKQATMARIKGATL